MPGYVYILYSQKFRRYYVGSTDDLNRRLSAHNAGNTPTTKPFRPWDIMYSESYQTIGEARHRERSIKAWKNRGYMLKRLGLAEPG